MTANKSGNAMIKLPYSLVIEATEEPDYFGFYSPDLEGFLGIGHSVEDCFFKAKWGMKAIPVNELSSKYKLK